MVKVLPDNSTIDYEQRKKEEKCQWKIGCTNDAYIHELDADMCMSCYLEEFDIILERWVKRRLKRLIRNEKRLKRKNKKKEKKKTDR